MRKGTPAGRSLFPPPEAGKCSGSLLTFTKNGATILCKSYKENPLELVRCQVMADKHTKDLTTGSPMKLVLSFMLPLLFGLLFQQFYSMVDTVVVGKYLGVDALAGVGSTGSVNFLVLGFCMGICSGFAIPVAQKFGQRDYDGLRRIVGTMIWLGAGFALVITAVTALLCGRILHWMHTPAETFGYAYDYIFIIFLGIPATMLYNLLSGIIRSLGDSRTPLLFLIFSSLLNVALDLALIVGLKLGVAGAGIATVVSQAISGILCLVFIARNYAVLRLRREDLKPGRESVSLLLTMGVPMGLQYSITAIGSILLQTAVNDLGPEAMAAVTAGNKVSMFCVCPFDAIGTTAATFAGQNVGAGKLDRVHQGVKASAVIGIGYAVAIFGVLSLWGGDLSLLFLDAKEAEIIAMSRKFLFCNSLFYIALLFVNLLRFTIQGLGFSRLAVFAGVFEMVARAVVALCMVDLLGYTAVCLAHPCAWIMADVFLFPAYFHCMRKLGYRPENRGGRRLTLRRRAAIKA